MPSALVVPPTDEPSMTSDELMKGLQLLLGVGAGWTGWHQDGVVSPAAAESGRRARISLSRGSGKSMAWMVTATACALAGKRPKAIFVVLPCKFLMEHHLDSAVKKGLGASIDMSIMGFTSTDIGQSFLPPCLADKLLLPDIVFFSLEALSNLVRFHASRIKERVKDGLIHRIFIDEIHLAHGERFRPSCGILPRIVALNIPVMTMSGSLPDAFTPCLLSHLGACNQDKAGEVDLVECEELLGHFPMGFDACDDRPSEPESGWSTDLWSFANHKQNGILILSSIALPIDLSSALTKGTFFLLRQSQVHRSYHLFQSS